MSKFKRIIRYDLPIHFALLLTNWLPDNVIFLRFRGWLISPFFKKCGKNLRLGRNITFYQSFNIEIGDDVYIALGNWFCASTTIKIASEVQFGPYCIIVSGNHSRKNGSFRYANPVIKPIEIGFGTWIGGNCSVLAGSEIGKGSVISANSVVKGEVPPNSLFVGNPGSVVKTFHD